MPSQNGGRRRNSSNLDAAHSAPEARQQLTPREVEVVEWIGKAKRNRAIGQILGCSPRTVQKHVQHILEKLHMETRMEVCAWWYERQLDRENRAHAPRKTVSV